MCARALMMGTHKRGIMSEQLKESLLRALGVVRTPEALARKYGNRWLTKWRANREIRRRGKVELLQVARAHMRSSTQLAPL